MIRKKKKTYKMRGSRHCGGGCAKKGEAQAIEEEEAMRDQEKKKTEVYMVFKI